MDSDTVSMSCCNECEIVRIIINSSLNNAILLPHSNSIINVMHAIIMMNYRNAHHTYVYNSCTHVGVKNIVSIRILNYVECIIMWSAFMSM